MNRRIIIILILAVLAVSLFLYVSRDKPIEIIIHAAKTGLVESTVANTRAGTLKACRRARLSPSTGGQIAKLHVHEGDHVESGQVMLELWNDDLAAQLELAQSEATSSAANAEEACLVADEAVREARRQQTLLQKQLTSEGEADRAQTNARAKKARCDATKASAQVSRARVSVARALLEQTRLKAPFTGTVAKINGELAEFVTPSPIGVATPPAVDLIDDTCLYISAPIDEVDAPNIRPGMDARIALDAFSEKRFPGIVQRIAPYVLEVEKQARTVDVETVFANPDDFKRMLPGYSADVELILDVRENTLRIPTEALLEGNRVFVYKPDNERIEERQIKTGLSNWKFTEVISGLEAGEQVVVSVDREGVQEGAYAIPEQTMKTGNANP